TRLSGHLRRVVQHCRATHAGNRHSPGATPTPTGDPTTPTGFPSPSSTGVPAPDECVPDNGEPGLPPRLVQDRPLGESAPEKFLDAKDHLAGTTPEPDPARVTVTAVADELVARVGLRADWSAVDYANFAGVMIEPSASRTWLYWKGALPGDIAGFVSGLRTRYPTVDIVVRPARYGLLELNAARARITSRIESGPPLSFDAHTFTVPPQGHCLEVELSASAGEDPAQLLERARAELEAVTDGVLVRVAIGIPIEFTTGLTGSLAQLAAAAQNDDFVGRLKDREPYWAGIRLPTAFQTGDAQTPLGYQVCTSGFAVTKVDVDHLLTAAHCFFPGYSLDAFNGKTHDKADAAKKVGKLERLSRQRDTALISVARSEGKGYGGGIDKIGTPKADYKERYRRFADYAMMPPHQEKEGAPITNKPEGDICVSGATTGEHCGLTVTRANTSWKPRIPDDIAKIAKDIVKEHENLVVGPVSSSPTRRTRP
ncbi:MAG: S1 family peptidase, partial [Sporichthyaceae bacterium]|nr:S1 family peptidase [Sporichthyaceae bacterium]